MATRLSYALPIARHLVTTTIRRFGPGGLSGTLPPPGEGPLIIVTGSGRSGTSAVARVLHESGLRMGSEFDPPSELSQFNVVGYYEDTAVRSVNLRMLGELGLTDIRRSRNWPWRSAVLAVADGYRAEMAELAAQPVDGWKDPLFCVTLEAWLPVLRRRPKVVVCLRSPEAYLHSVTRMIGLVPRAAVEWWWANELRRLLAVIHDYQLEATCIEYNDLVQKPEETVAALAAFVGRPLDATYVEPALRHFDQRVPRRYARLYEQVRALDGREHPPVAVEARRSGLLSRVGRRRGRELSDAERSEIAAYLARVRTIDQRVAAAKAAWETGVGVPSFKLTAAAQGAQGSNGAREETRAASEAFVAVLHETQRELGAMEPPPDFEAYHEATTNAVHLERLVTQLALQSSDGTFPVEKRWPLTVMTWQRFTCPQAAAETERRRENEFARARKRAGYAAGSQASV